MNRNIDRFVRQMRDQVAQLEVPREIEDQFGSYRDRPADFCREILGVESACRRSNGEQYQFRVLQDLADCDRVAVRSGHGPGKTTLDAWALIWFLVTRPLSRVVVLAPEFSRQIRAIVFSEVRKWVRRSKVTLPLNVMASRVMVGGFGEEWSATGMGTAGDPDRIEGFHAEGGLLVIADEMKGIPAEAFDAVQGALTGEDAKVLVTSVPGGAGVGPFWRVFANAGDRWRLHHIPSTDSDRVRPEWVEEMADRWGRGSPLYQMRVLGEFADAGEGVLFPFAVIEKAQQADVKPSEQITLGVDVARSVAGDLNAIAIARGGWLDGVTTWHSTDLMEVAQRVMQEVAKHGPARIRVDVGGVGAGVADRLREHGYFVEDVYFGGGALDAQRFRNARAEMYWSMRERMEAGEVHIPDDEVLTADLSAQRYEFTQDGKIKLESKDETRKRAGHSPDRSDAVALALGGDIAPIVDAFEEWFDGELYGAFVL